MGRPERPIDPEAGPVAEFAGELRRLRDKAGRPSYRELAKRSSFSVTVLSEAAGGQSFPTLAVVRGYVQACGGDTGEWEERWRDAASRQREERAGPERPAPYLGLASYEPDQAGLFFGREELTAELLGRLAAGRFLAVFGPSGSGKSSLLRAGLLAAVRRGELDGAAYWVTVLLTPGERPVTNLAARLAAMTGIAADEVRDVLAGPAGPAGPAAAAAAALARQPAGTGLLLVVDQFEELFTVCRDTGERNGFIRALLALAAPDGEPCRVVLGVRADYYAHCAAWPELVTALHDRQVLVGPMDADQLRDVIVKPAEQTGAAVERALVATAVAEASAEPGALALVSHALLETWLRSPPGRLTLTAYQQSGGVPHAISSTAERLYSGCDHGQRRILRRIFLRLVALGDGSPDARRLVEPGELAAGTDAGTAAALVEKLAEARLVTVDDGSVQLAHEALIRFWPRLADWLADSRDDLRVQRRLADAAAEWGRNGRDPAALYRGTPLAAARAWAERDAGLTGLTQAEQDFLDASSAAQDAGHAAALRAARRLRRLAVALVILLVAVSAAAGAAVWQRHAALAAKNAAVSGQFATLAGALATANSAAAVLAALAAWQAEPTTAARSALVDTTACCTATQTALDGESGTVNAVALAPGGGLLAAGGHDGTVHLWRTADRRPAAELSGFSAPVTAVAFSPNGTVLAAGSDDRTIRLWYPARLRDVARQAPFRTLTATAAVGGLAFSPDGAWLAAASADGRVQLWDPGTGRPGPVLALGGSTHPVAFAPDGRLAVGTGRSVTLWDLTGPGRPHASGLLGGATTAVTSLDWSSGGDIIAGQEADGDVLLWNTAGKAPLRLRQAVSGGGSGRVAFSRDGRVLITAGNYFGITLWDTGSGGKLYSDNRELRGDTRTLAYDPASGTLALAGYAGSVQLWQAPIAPFTGAARPVTGLAVLPGGTTIAAVSSDDRVRLWRLDGTLVTSASPGPGLTAVAVNRGGTLLAVADAGGVAIRALPGLGPVRQLSTPAPATGVLFSPDGGSVAAAAGPSVSVWATATGARRLLLTPGDGNVNAIAYSPDGRTMAVATNRGEISLLDARTGLVTGQVRPGTGPANVLAFAPDGRLLAAAGNDGDVTLWDPADLRHRTVLTGPGGSIRALAFSPGGQNLAAGDNNGAILLWDVASRSVTDTLTSRQGTVRALAFTPDGQELISGGSSHRVVVWDLDPGRTARADCRILARDPGLPLAQTLVPGASYARLCASGR